MPFDYSSSHRDSTTIILSLLDPVLYLQSKFSLIRDPSDFVNDSEISLGQLEVIGHSDIVCLRNSVAFIVL